MAKITAVIGPIPRLSGSIKKQPVLKAAFKNVTIVTETREKYKGPYIVQPMAKVGTVLQTAEKIMEKNVTVTQIPSYEVSNKFGKTFVIE